MRDKDKIPNITNDNEQEYWQEFKNTQSPYIREALINKYSPLVKYAADRIYVNMDTQENVELQDLFGFGAFGLMDAINKYNPNNVDINFKTYALDKISRAIYDGLRELDYLSDSMRDVWYAGDDSNDKTEYVAERENTKNKIVDALKKLPEKEKQVIILYYYYDLTLKEVANILEVPESKISQLHTKAINDIKDLYKNGNILEPRLSRNIKPQEMTDIFIIPVSQYNETMKNYIETPTTYLSDVWYVDDDYDEISVIDTLKSKTNHEYFIDREYTKNKIIADLKKLPEKVTKAVIIIIKS
ncbi:sigma-70 family RNA polymerase sigma factor [Brachyspira innocens]|uniref:sigma-70 family RNA polymerase sigma factor n=1 Tax=Brachyspira innocens TaxID=13264 RepID=UPI00036833B0|nr:sigma-70 family RNA polymerase sigma factor [Brachyspira innocens]